MDSHEADDGTMPSLPSIISPERTPECGSGEIPGTEDRMRQAARRRLRLVEPPQVVAKRTVEDCDAVSDQLHDECRSETVGTNPVAVSC